MKVSRLPGSLAKGAMVRAGSMVTGKDAADSHAGSTPTSTLTVSAWPSATSASAEGSATSAEGTVVVAVVGSTDVVVTPEVFASSSLASAGAVAVGASEASGGGGVLSAAGAVLVGTIRTDTGVVAAGPALDKEAS